MQQSIMLGTLAAPLVARRRFEALGFRCLGDYARERMGVSAVSERVLVRLPLARTHHGRWQAAVELAGCGSSHPADLRAGVRPCMYLISR